MKPQHVKIVTNYKEALSFIFWLTLYNALATIANLWKRLKR
jgi:hypothetical protein